MQKGAQKFVITVVIKHIGSLMKLQYISLINITAWFLHTDESSHWLSFGKIHYKNETCIIQGMITTVMFNECLKTRWKNWVNARHFLCVCVCVCVYIYIYIYIYIYNSLHTYSYTFHEHRMCDYRMLYKSQHIKNNHKYQCIDVCWKLGLTTARISSNYIKYL